MRDKENDKIVDLNDYLAEKDFEEVLQSELAGFSDEELDELYDDLAFGQEFEEELQAEEAELAKETIQRLRTLAKKESEGRLSWLASQPIGWSHLEERPYLSDKMELAILYKQNGLYQKALDHLLEIYKYDANDSLGTRYEIMALYVLMSRHDELKAFYASKADHQNDLMMAIPYMISGILEGQEDAVEDELDKWLPIVDGLFELCSRLTLPMEEIMEAASLESYQANSLSAVYVSLSSFLAILIPSAHYIMSVFHQLLEIEEPPLIETLHIFNSIQLNTLTNFGIRYVSDIAEWSEEEFSAIPNIGKATIVKLKEKGVAFHS